MENQKMMVEFDLKQGYAILSGLSYNGPSCLDPDEAHHYVTEWFLQMKKQKEDRDKQLATMPKDIQATLHNILQHIANLDQDKSGHVQANLARLGEELSGRLGL